MRGLLFFLDHGCAPAFLPVQKLNGSSRSVLSVTEMMRTPAFITAIWHRHLFPVRQTLPRRRWQVDAGDRESRTSFVALPGPHQPHETHLFFFLANQLTRIKNSEGILCCGDKDFLTRSLHPWRYAQNTSSRVGSEACSSFAFSHC